MKIYFKILTLVLLTSFIGYNLYGQRGPGPGLDKTSYFDAGKKFYCETHFLPTNSPDSTKVIILFRISYATLSFDKTINSNQSKGSFLSVPGLEIEFKDSLGIIRKGELWNDSVFLRTFDETNSKTDFVRGKLESQLPIGKYTITARLHDQNIQNIRKFLLPSNNENSFQLKPTISQPLFAFNDSTQSDEFELFVLGNRISFTSRGERLFLIASYQGEKNEFSYICKYLGDKKNNLFGNNEFNISGKLVPEKDMIFKINSKKDGKGYLLKKEPYSNNGISMYNISLLELVLPVEKILPGEYEISLFNTSLKDTSKYKFEVYWEDMPLSLRNPYMESIVEMMYYILSDEEYDNMHSGSSKEISEKILDYWKKQDPTPNTPYNEALSEYFSRVDFAMFNYQTMTEKNGAKTDRGKIYILYGSPSSVDRNLNDNTSIELWRYGNLKKEFVFEMVTTGVYKLKKINEL